MARYLSGDLTKRYSSLFEKKGIGKISSFVQDVYKYGKFREIVSFTVWEIYHRLGLFPKNQYITFTSPEAIALESETISSAQFDEKVTQWFKSRGLSASKSEHNWKLLCISNDQILGCVYPQDTDLYRSADQGKTLVFVKRFPESIKSIFVSNQNVIFVCARGAVYRSIDNGVSFQKTLELGSQASFFRFNNEMTETPNGLLVIGEYGNVWEKTGWKKLAYLYFSVDNGATWKKSDYFIQRGANKHVHIVKYSQLLNRLIAADGDNYKRLWISEPLDQFDAEKPAWNLVNRFHIQMGGHTSVVESEGKIHFGTDYQGGTNFLVETVDGKKFTKRIVPDPYRRSPIDNMVLRTSAKGHEIWANLPFSTSGTKCLLMYTTDNGSSWNKAFEYQRKTHSVWLISSSNGMTDSLYLSIEDSKNNTRAVYRIANQS